MFFPEENCRFCDHSATKTLDVYWLIKILIEQIKGSHSFNWIEAYQLTSWITVLSANPNRLVAGFLRGAWPMLLVHKNKPTVRRRWATEKLTTVQSEFIPYSKLTGMYLCLIGHQSCLRMSSAISFYLTCFFDICRSQLFSR